MVSGRSAHWTKEWPGSPLGKERNPAPAARRPALRQCLSIRCDLSQARHGCSPRAAQGKHRSDATASRRDQQICRPKSPCRDPNGHDHPWAGWHSTGKLVVPKNITIILLPSKSPELNPVENIWQYLRSNYLSNRVFKDYTAIVDAACDAWNALIDTPQIITSIGMREWAHV